MLTQITQTKAHSCEVFDYFAVVAIKNTIWRCLRNYLNFNKLFIKTLRLAAIRRLGSSLFYSITVDGKKNFFQKVMFSRK